jgi:hypothetical protein
LLPGVRQPARQIAALKPTYPAAHSTGISKIPRLHKDVPPLRFQKCPFSAKGKIVMANSHRSHESNADEMHPIQMVTKTKIGTLATHRSKKLYVHATMKNEALLDAKMEWGRMTPSPTRFGREKCRPKPGDEKQQKATTNSSLFVASAPEVSSLLAAFCHLNSSPFVALCRYLRRDFISL